MKIKNSRQAAVAMLDMLNHRVKISEGLALAIFCVGVNSMKRSMYGGLMVAYAMKHLRENQNLLKDMNSEVVRERRWFIGYHRITTLPPEVQVLLLRPQERLALIMMALGGRFDTKKAKEFEKFAFSFTDEQFTGWGKDAE